MQTVIPSFTYTPYVVPRLFLFFIDVDFFSYLEEKTHG